VMLHPFQREFWNREDALPALGFDALHFHDGFLEAPTHGWYVTDGALYERMLALLPDDPDAAPQLLFAITMENHGPWNIPRPLSDAELAAQPLPDGLPDAAQLELRNYFALLQSGDLALGAFADALLARERPTLLFVYGDHLPDLSASYAALGFDNGRKPWQQTVPYILVGNVGYPEATLDTDSEFMASLLLDALQLPYDGYLSLNAVARDTLAFAPLQQADIDYVRNVMRHAAQLDYAEGGLEFDLPASPPP
jgi:phosphoglycerol transferase MdoB-like AlkP superfamily enzyme